MNLWKSVKQKASELASDAADVAEAKAKDFAERARTEKTNLKQRLVEKLSESE